MGQESKMYQPVPSSNSMEDDPAMNHEILSALYTSKRRMFYLALGLTTILVISNGIWLKQWVSPPSEAHPHLDPSYYNSSVTSLQPFHWNTDFSTDNKSLSNKLWGSVFPAGAGLVSVPTTWAREKQLPVSIQDPENPNHSVYFTAVLHQIHCLTVVRASLYHYAEDVEQTVPWEHVMHCLDSLRQTLMCNLDDTLLYTETGNIWGDGQVHVCRDWGKFTEWVELHAKKN